MQLWAALPSCPAAPKAPKGHTIPLEKPSIAFLQPDDGVSPEHSHTSFGQSMIRIVA